MKKSEFVAEVAKKIGMPQNKTNDLVNAVLDVITDTLKASSLSERDRSIKFLMLQAM